MSEFNYKTSKPKKWWEKLTENVLYKLAQMIFFILTILFGDLIGIFDLLDMDLQQGLLLIALLIAFIFWIYFHKKMVQSEISNAVDQKFKKINDQLDSLYAERKINRNRRIIQNELNTVIAKSLSELEKDELSDLIESSNKPLIEFVTKKSELGKRHTKAMVSDFMDKNNYQTYLKNR